MTLYPPFTSPFSLALSLSGLSLPFFPSLSCNRSPTQSHLLCLGVVKDKDAAVLAAVTVLLQESAEPTLNCTLVVLDTADWEVGDIAKKGRKKEGRRRSREQGW